MHEPVGGRVATRKPALLPRSEMLVRHDWVTRYSNGLRYIEKAPLMVWWLATSYTLFGIRGWSTRLPLILGVLALLLAIYKLSCYAYGELGGP